MSALRCNPADAGRTSGRRRTHWCDRGLVRRLPFLGAVVMLMLVVLAACSATAKLTAKEATYLDALEAQTTDLDESFERYVGLMDPSNPLLTWTSGMAAEADVWARLRRDAGDLTPPARFEELHGKNLEMLDLLVTAGHDLAYAGANSNPFYLASGSEYFNRGYKLAGEVKRMLKDAR